MNFTTESYVSVVKVQSKTGTAFSLNLANVFVGNTLCGQLPNNVTTSTWYTVTCSSTIKGTFVKLVHTTDNYLEFADVEVQGKENTEVAISWKEISDKTETVNE